jgi:hypothetical protein
MYRKPRFLEKLHEIRQEMARECDYDAEQLAEMVRSGWRPSNAGRRSVPMEPPAPVPRSVILKPDPDAD